jgi:hypothetical protein
MREREKGPKGVSSGEKKERRGSSFPYSLLSLRESTGVRKNTLSKREREGMLSSSLPLYMGERECSLFPSHSL